MDYQRLSAHEESNYSLANSPPYLANNILPGPVLSFACSVLRAASMCVQHPPNDSPPDSQGERRGQREKQTPYKVVNHSVTSDEAGQTLRWREGRALRASASAHQAAEPKTTPSGSRQREGPFCRVKLIRNALED